MPNQEQLVAIQNIKCQLQNKYPSLSQEDCDMAFNLALSNYLVKKYPSQNNRPTPETLDYDFVTLMTIYKIMDYLSGASGIPIGVKEYSENGLKFVFDESVLANYCDIGLPKAGVPR